MAKVIDIRALQGAGRSGVEVYIEGFLYDFFKIKKVYLSTKVILWVNANEDVILPNFIADYLRFDNVSLVHTKVPNKILNILCSILRWPKINNLKGLEKMDELFVLDPRPAPVSKTVKKNIVVHDLSSIKFPHFFSLRSKMWFLTIRLKKELLEADKIYAVSEFTKSEIVSFDPVLESKVTVLYPKLISSKQAIRLSDGFSENVRKKYAIPDQPFLFTISTLEPRKNIETIIAKFLNGDFPEFQNLVIAGVGNERIFKKTRYVNHKSIMFIGQVEENEKWALYNMASGFIFLSHYEGFGIPVKDAMNFGLPLILSDIPVFREIVGDYNDVIWVRI